MAAVDAEVVAFAVPPLLAGIVIVVGGTLLLVVLDELAGGGSVDVLSLAHGLDAVVDVGGDEDVDHVLVIAQHIVGSTAYENTVALVGCLLDGIALKLVQSFLREVVVIEIVVAQERQMGVEERLEESLLLIVLLEEFLGESALLGCQVEQFTVVALATEILCQLLCDDVSATAYLSAHVYNYLSHKVLFFVECIFCLFIHC